MVAPLATVGGHVDPSLYLALATALAVGMGGILFLAGLLRLGFIGDFFGKPVLLGYINGVALNEPLPKAALGVIIVVAAIGLIDVRSIWQLRKVRPAEVVLAFAAFGGVLVFGVLGGIAIAIGLSIGVFLHRAARPHDAVLGAVEGVDGYHDIERWENAEVVAGLLVYRFDAPPFFVNAEYLGQRVMTLSMRRRASSRWC
jgi:SulP family sulfate permease